jgi:hypothetical protein
MTTLTQRTRWFFLTAAGIVLAAIALLLGNRHTAGLAQVTDIVSVDQLRSEFNLAAGKPRLLLILSPT